MVDTLYLITLFYLIFNWEGSSLGEGRSEF